MSVETDVMDVRPAEESELPAVMNVLDGAMLQVDAPAVRGRIADDGVLVAVQADRVLGACVVDTHAAGSHGGDADAYVEALAVRPGRRGQGIGSSLIATAADRWGTLAAQFDADLRPFYERLGFDVEAIDDDRCRGVSRRRR